MSLVSKYEELDRLIYQNHDEQINEVFREILNETFKLINNKIENQKTLDANNPEEKAAIRAMLNICWNYGMKVRLMKQKKSVMIWYIL
jgi:hypothetical protein